MSKSSKRASPRTPVSQRVAAHGWRQTPLGLTRENLLGELVAGITLLALAIPEQLATAQLASVPAFTAMIAFIAATLVFVVVGANPILSIGADSTIAPLFAVALLHLALGNSAAYLALVAACAVVTGIMVVAVGVLKLGWLADFLSLPIIAGFMSGIGVIIMIHQLPQVLGVVSRGSSVWSRLSALSHQLNHANSWTVLLALGTLLLMMIGEHWRPRLPLALVAVLGATLVCATLSLSHHGVVELGSVVVGAPSWRLRWFSVHEWGAIVTTALTLVVVIVSQSAATSRTVADEIGVAQNLDRDFVGIGVANIVAGLAGAMPVNASPARTMIVSLAGGRTKMVALVAGLGALVLVPLARFVHAIPLAALAGVLLFVAGRLIKVATLRAIARTSRAELLVALTCALGVIILGVQIGLAVAVGLAILLRTWHSSRPRMVELGRRHATTSWEPLTTHDVDRVAHVLAVLFGESLYFANVGAFRRELYRLLAQHHATRHVVIDAVAIADLDYTGLAMLRAVADDLLADAMTVSVARANESVRQLLTSSRETTLLHIQIFDSVDAAVNHAVASTND